MLVGAKSIIEDKNELIFKLFVLSLMKVNTKCFNIIVSRIKIAESKIILDNISKFAFLSEIFHHK
jgi:hypothetical protein